LLLIARKKTAETTYCSEFMVALHACEQTIDLHYTLYRMGIPSDGVAWAFGDNTRVITCSIIPQSNLAIQHNALSYHGVCESIAAKIQTKALGWVNFLPLVQPFLF
jgi:hypothetical protein